VRVWDDGVCDVQWRQTCVQIISINVQYVTLQLLEILDEVHQSM
jgi:hypothetical protein